VQRLKKYNNLSQNGSVKIKGLFGWAHSMLKSECDPRIYKYLKDCEDAIVLKC
jgi:hypothetical protein